MAMVVKCATFLHASASPGFSSAKLSSLSSSSSLVSSIPAQSRLPGFKGPNLRSSSTLGLVIISAQARDDESTNEDFQSVLVKRRNKLQGELAQNKKQIERLRAVIELACTELSKVVESFQKIEQELSAEPETENHTDHGEEGLQRRAKRPRPTRSDFLNSKS